MFARVLTALVIAPAFILLALYLPTRWFSLVLLALMLLALEEWNRLTLKSSPWLFAVSMVVAVLCWLLPAFPELFQPVCILAALAWIYLGTGLLRYDPDKKFDDPASFVLGAALLTGAWSGLVYLHQQDQDGPLIMISMMAIVWAADSFAYFTGKSMGKRKLAPALSPNKTVEGLMGGIAGAAAVAAILGILVLDFGVSHLVPWMIAGIAAALVSVIGDLYQSGLKRSAGVKDSGNILPGHGGVLDRIDGVIAAAPVFAGIWSVLG